MVGPEHAPGTREKKTGKNGGGSREMRVMACIDGTEASRKVIPHALAVAAALGARLTIVHVIEAPQTGEGPFDPVTWELRRHEAQAHVEAVAKAYARDGQAIETRILEGHSAEQIASFARETAADLTCMCTHGDGDAPDGLLGETARRVIAAATGSVLLVPNSAPVPAGAVAYTRIFVPLDGSARAESALQVAIDIAHSHDAELVLGHATPEPHLTRIGPFEAEDEDLAERVRRRNERVATAYLERMRNRLSGRKVPARVVVVSGGDVRRTLAQAVTEADADLVVIASHGHSGHTDVASGDVAAYLMTHVRAPLVIVRSQAMEHGPGSENPRVAGRLPDRAER